MTERELKKLSRVDLLELLLAQNKEMEALRGQLAQAQEQLTSRMVKLEQAGSIAEASLQLNGVFEAAQSACDQYLMNVQRICAQMEQETRESCERMLAATNRA